MNRRWIFGIVAAAVAGVPAWAGAYFQSELIFPGQSKHCHGSSIVECPNGDLLACWFFGSGERGADDVMVQGARLKKGAGEWSPVFVMADTPGTPDCNPVLFIDAKERLWLVWIAVRANAWEHAILKYRRAEKYLGSGAPEWSWQDIILLRPGAEFPAAVEKGFKELDPPEPCWAEYAPKYTEMIIEAAKDKAKREEGWMTRIHPLEIPSGRILLPLYSDGFNMSMVAISDDQGETWRASLPIVGLGPIQPALVRKQDGSIMAYMRDSGGPPERALWSESKDEGESWSPALDTDIPNPGSSLEVLALKDGRWVMILNDTEDGRYVLSLAMSDDEGKTWKWKRELERAERGKAGYAYPSIVQGKDGRLQMTYSHHEGDAQKSIKHVALDPAWITEKP